MKQASRKNKLNELYKPVGIIDDFPVGDGVVVGPITNGLEITEEFI